MGLVRVAVIAFALVGCLQSESKVCESGLVCSGQLVCDEVHGLCVLPDQLTACANLAEGMECTFGDNEQGFCTDGVCIATYCGDGLVTGNEECEVAVDAEADCMVELGFYDPGLTADCVGCVWDRDTCTGKCGDGVRDFDHGEYCDGSLPTGTGDSCVTFGFDAGTLGCNTQFCTPGFANCAALRWTQQAAFAAETRSVWAFKRSDGVRVVHVVGDEGALGYYDGTAWSNPALPSTADRATLDVIAVWGTSDTDVYAVGGDATTGGSPFIWRFDGAQWTVMTLPASVTATLEGVWVGGGTGFAVGRNGTLLRLTGGAWEAVTSGTTARFNAVWAASPTNVFIATTTGVAKFDGTTLTMPSMSAPATLFAAEMLSIHGLPSGDVYAVGVAGSAYHFAGAWTRIDTPVCTDALFDVWASRPDDVYAAAWGQSGKSHTVFHYDGRSWAPLVTPSTLWTRTVFGTGEGDIWLGTPAGLFRGTGSFFGLRPLGPSADCRTISPPGPVATCADQAMTAIAGASEDDVYAFGAQGGCHYNGENWEPIAADFSSLTSAWVGSDGTAFAIGSVDTGSSVTCGPGDTRPVFTGKIAQGSGSSFTISTLASVATHTRVLDVWGSASNDVYIVGETGASPCNPTPMIRHWNGVGWSAFSLPTATGISINRIWGRSANDFYVSGFGNYGVHRYNGSWTQLPALPTPFLPTFHDLSGTASDVIVTQINDARLHRFDGNAWHSTQPHDVGGLPRLVALGTNDVFVFGSSQSSSARIAHYRSDLADPIRYESAPVANAWGTSKRLFWVGSDGIHTLVRSVAW